MTRHWIGILLLPLLVGCQDRAYYYMASDSPIPRRWADDSRTRDWRGFAIRYELVSPDQVHAIVGERAMDGRQITATGHYRFEPYDGPNPAGQAYTLYVTFDGVEERYRVYEMSSVFITLPAKLGELPAERNPQGSAH